MNPRDTGLSDYRYTRISEECKEEKLPCHSSLRNFVILSADSLTNSKRRIKQTISFTTNDTTTMSILLNKKFLALFAMVACIASFSMVDAGRVRSRRNSNEQQRVLKGGSKKGSKGSGGSSGQSSQTSTTTTAAIPTTIVQPAVNPNSVQGFRNTCPNKANDLDSCVSNAGGTSLRCMTCLYAISNLGSATPEGLRSCSNPNISSGMCSECYTDAQNFYNCATGSSFGVVITVDADSNTAVVGTGGVVVSGEPVVTAGQYGPTSLCPSPTAGELVPQSGDMCYTGDYDFLECFYTGLKCTCRNDYTTWLCVEYEGAN